MIGSQRKIWQSLMFFSGDHIYADINKQSSMGYIHAMNQSAIKLLKSTAITCLIIVTTMNIYVGFPITVSMFSDELQLPVPVYLPFTDYTTTYGLALNLVNNVFVGSVGLAGNLGVEIITSMLKNTVWACIVAVGHSIEEMSILMKNPKQNQKRIIASQFRNILVQVQDFDR